VKRVQVEDVLLRGPENGLAALLAPERVDRMAREMQTYYAERLREMQTRAVERRASCRSSPRALSG